MKIFLISIGNHKNIWFNNFKSIIFLILLISLKFGYVETAYGQPACSSYTNWTSGMWIGPGSHCGSPYGGTTVSSVLIVLSFLFTSFLILLL
jgi:hypothetical protein